MHGSRLPMVIVAVLANLVLMPMFVARGEGETLVIPRDLYGEAQRHGCDQLSDFFDRPGVVGPAHVYGILPGPLHDSAAFWCKRTGDLKNDEAPYQLVVVVNLERRMPLGCPSVIRGWNYPGGLRVIERPGAKLTGFKYVQDPHRRGPGIVVVKSRIIVSEYGEVAEWFYCHRGEWLVLLWH